LEAEMIINCSKFNNFFLLCGLMLALACTESKSYSQKLLPNSEWKADASSGEGDYKPELAIDGDMKTRWSSNFTDDEWFRIDFGQVSSIAGFRINWEAAYGRDYDILLSEDGKEWEKVYEVRWSDGGISIF